MSDTLSRVKLQLRPVNGSALNGNINGNGGDDNTPSSPASKLLINHGKPNYTIQRSPKAQQNGTNPLCNESQNNNRNNYYPYKSAGVKGTTGIISAGNGTLKSNAATNNNSNIYNSSNNSQNCDDLVIQSTKFNGVFKPANVQQLENKDDADNQIVLRRVPKPEPAATAQNGNDENVPEFILRQRRIQERLAKENILDFDTRRSGYFTHVVISPTSPNRTSLVETMSSPPIVPALEIPPPTKETKEASIAEENIVEQALEESLPTVTNGSVEEEEVARAIEEVNKAVAGEADDEKPEVNVVEEEKAVASEKVAATEVQTVVEQHQFEDQGAVETKEEHKVEPAQVEESKVEEAPITAVSIVVTSVPLIEAGVSAESVAEPVADVVVEQPSVETEETAITTAHIVETDAVEIPKPYAHEQSTSVEQFKENGLSAAEDVPKTNGYTAEDVTISHTNDKVNGLSNGLATPSLPTPDPSGALGVNYEPKTVVSFSKDLGEPNKYPDTVKVAKKVEEGAEKNATDELKELAKLKFDIKADNEDVQVTPVLRTE